MAGMVSTSRKVLAELRSASSAMSPALGRIAACVLAQPDQVLSLTVTELAEASGSSEASVIRFCRDLDFESFQAFKLALATELAGQSSKSTSEETGWSDLDAIADRAILAVRETQDLQRRETIDLLVGRLLKARRITAVGFGASAVTASYVQYKLTRLGLACTVQCDPHMAAMSVAQMTRDDVVLVVSSSGSTLDAVRVANLAKEREVFLSVLTNRVRSPLSGLADAVLVAASPETPLTGGAFASKVSQFMVIELLYACLIRVSPEAEAAVGITARSVTDRGY